MADIIARLARHRKADAIELIYGYAPLSQSMRLGASAALTPVPPARRPLAAAAGQPAGWRNGYALARRVYRGTMTRFRNEMMLSCRIPLPSLFP